MNQMEIFKNPEFGSVRVIEENGKYLFCGVDVAKALGYTKPQNAIDRHCPHALKRGIHPLGKGHLEAGNNADRQHQGRGQGRGRFLGQGGNAFVLRPHRVYPLRGTGRGTELFHPDRDDYGENL